MTRFYQMHENSSYDMLNWISRILDETLHELSHIQRIISRQMTLNYQFIGRTRFGIGFDHYLFETLDMFV